MIIIMKSKLLLSLLALVIVIGGCVALTKEDYRKPAVVPEVEEPLIEKADIEEAKKEIEEEAAETKEEVEDYGDDLEEKI